MFCCLFQLFRVDVINVNEGVLGIFIKTAGVPVSSQIGDVIGDVTVRTDELSDGYACTITNQNPGNVLQLDNTFKHLLVNDIDALSTDQSANRRIDITIECHDVNTPSLRMTKDFTIPIIPSVSAAIDVVCRERSTIPENLPTGTLVCHVLLVNRTTGSALDVNEYELTGPNPAATDNLGLALRRVTSPETGDLVDQVYVSDSSLLSYELHNPVTVPVTVSFMTGTAEAFSTVIIIRVSRHNCFPSTVKTGI